MLTPENGIRYRWPKRDQMYKISLKAFVINSMTENIINLEHLKVLRLSSWVRRSKKKPSSLVMGELRFPEAYAGVRCLHVNTWISVSTTVTAHTGSMNWDEKLKKLLAVLSKFPFCKKGHCHILSLSPKPMSSCEIIQIVNK